MSLLPIKKWWRPLSITRRLIIGFTSSFVLLIILFSIIFDMIITHSVWNVAKIYARQEMSTLLAIVNNPAERDKNLMRELSWNEGEDMKLTKDWLSSGILPRFNPFSSCKTLSWRHGEFPRYDFNPYKLGKRHFPIFLEIKDRFLYETKKLAKRILRKI